jgi:ABC-type amino acid transport substrate-binding protein
MMPWRPSSDSCSRIRSRCWRTLSARAVLAAVLGAAVIGAAACSSAHTAGGSTFVPARRGVLSVATAFVPAPGFWEGDPPTGGFEAGLAAALARRLGLGRVEVVQVPFAEIVRGKLGRADIALSQLTPTKLRERSLDFTTPYLTAPPAVLARRTVQAADVHDLRGLRWVVSRVSTLTPIVMHRIRPTTPPLVVEDRAQALEVLYEGRAEALLLDLPVALGLARAGRYQVLGQLDGSEGLAAALPAGSVNREIVDSSIRALQADGTIDRLASRWLGKGMDDVPLILTEN